MAQYDLEQHSMPCNLYKKVFRDFQLIKNSNKSWQLPYFLNNTNNVYFFMSGTDWVLLRGYNFHAIPSILLRSGKLLLISLYFFIWLMSALYVCVLSIGTLCYTKYAYWFASRESSAPQQKIDMAILDMTAYTRTYEVSGQFVDKISPGFH